MLDFSLSMHKASHEWQTATDLDLTSHSLEVNQVYAKHHNKHTRSSAIIINQQVNIYTTQLMATKMVIYCNDCVTGANDIIHFVLRRCCRHWSTDNACTCSTGCMEQRAEETETQSTEEVQIRQISRLPG